MANFKDQRNDAYSNYYIGEGQLSDEDYELQRKQAQVDALRDRGMQGQEGKMVGNVYVAPSIAQYAAQLGNAYMGRKGQEGVDTRQKSQNAARIQGGTVLMNALRGINTARDEEEKRPKDFRFYENY